MPQKIHDAIIVGAGPAGLGVSAALKQMGVEHLVIDAHNIGHSFRNWPAQTCFISPSFTGNFFGLPDLNAITPDSSPAYALLTEHPTGKEYAQYLQAIADHHQLPTKTGIQVNKVTKKQDLLHLHTNQETLQAKNVVWACGEFNYPNTNAFNGAEHCQHYANIKDFNKLAGNKYVIIGGYEAGIDAAIQLAKQKKKSLILDKQNQTTTVTSDSSYSLSPYTRDQYHKHKQHITIQENTVEKILKQPNNYEIHLNNKETINTPHQPINATGFKTSIPLVKKHFTKQNKIQLTTQDESTTTKGLFLAGPQVQHDKAIFCFVYKYRQRFAIVAQTIAQRIGANKQHIRAVVEHYKKSNFYLEDLSCCNNKCEC